MEIPGDSSGIFVFWKTTAIKNLQPFLNLIRLKLDSQNP
jgi:hypothetical protein